MQIFVDRYERSFWAPALSLHNNVTSGVKKGASKEERLERFFLWLTSSGVTEMCRREQAIKHVLEINVRERSRCEHLPSLLANLRPLCLIHLLSYLSYSAAGFRHHTTVRSSQMNVNTNHFYVHYYCPAKVRGESTKCETARHPVINIVMPMQ